MSDTTDFGDGYTNVSSLDPYGDFDYATMLLGGAWMPTCTIIQGVPTNLRNGQTRDGIAVTEEAYPDDVQLFVSEQSAPILIAGLQKWLQDKAAYKTHPIFGEKPACTEQKDEAGK